MLTIHTYHKPEQSHPTAMFKFNSGQRRELVQELASCNLVFDFNTSETQSDVQVWRQLDVQVKDHLTKNMIQLASTERYGDTYLGLSWMLCKKNGQVEMPEYYHCTLDYIRNLAQAHPLHEQCKLFFIGKHWIFNLWGSCTYQPLTAPKARNLEAHVTIDSTLSDQAHPCWPWRVVSNLSWIKFPKNLSIEQNQCLPECVCTPPTATAVSR
jgi:hypothetical protein